MSRAELLKKICYTDYTSECSACDGRYNCSDCKGAINPLLDEYDKQIRADAIDECIAKIDTLEQISFGIAETDLVKSMLEQLKEQKND